MGELFRGEVRVTTKCLECEQGQSRTEHFLDVGVPVDSDGDRSLSWALSEFASCERCVQCMCGYFYFWWVSVCVCGGGLYLCVRVRTCAWVLGQKYRTVCAPSLSTFLLGQCLRKATTSHGPKYGVRA